MTKAQKLILDETKKAKQREREEQEKKLKQSFEYILLEFGIEYTKEVKLKNTKHRLDYVIVNNDYQKIAIALQGGVWSGGRHVNPQGYIADRTKYNTAVLEGWSVFELTTEHVDAMFNNKKIDSLTYRVTKAVLDFCKRVQDDSFIKY